MLHIFPVFTVLSSLSRASLSLARFQLFHIPLISFWTSSLFLSFHLFWVRFLSHSGSRLRVAYSLFFPTRHDFPYKLSVFWRSTIPSQHSSMVVSMLPARLPKVFSTFQPIQYTHHISSLLMLNVPCYSATRFFSCLGFILLCLCSLHNIFRLSHVYYETS